MIPAFTPAGLLPPYVGANAADYRGVSPYATDTHELAQRLGSSPQRTLLLQGLIAWRQALGAAGITGVQWVDGSFCEDIERIENRAPNDIDVVTFVVRPPHLHDQAQWIQYVAARPALFHPNTVRQQHGCHAFFVDVILGPGHLLAQTTYWYGLFTHRRVTHEWKGILSISLPSNDAAALAYLNAQPLAP